MKDEQDFESPEEHGLRYAQARRDLKRQEEISAEEAERARLLRIELAKAPPDPADVTHNPCYQILKIFPKGFFVMDTGRIYSVENTLLVEELEKGRVVKVTVERSPVFVRGTLG